MQTNPAAFPSVMTTTRSILAKEGAASFWKGAVPTAMGMVMENAMGKYLHNCVNLFAISQCTPAKSKCTLRRSIWCQ